MYIDIQQIRAVYIFLQEPKKRATVYFDNIRLEFENRPWVGSCREKQNGWARLGRPQEFITSRTLSNHACGVAGKDLKFSGVPEE